MYKIISIILLITIATITLGQNSDTTMEKSKKNNKLKTRSAVARRAYW